MVDFVGDSTDCTHVICRHRQQACCVWALRRGKVAVTGLWVWDCSTEGELMPLTDPVRVSLPLSGPHACLDQHITHR